MPRKTKSAARSEKIRMFLFGIIAAMTIILMATLIIRHEVNKSVSVDSRVSVGAMAYDFSSGKAVKRTDETVKNLRNFLVETAEVDTGESCISHYSVMVASEDEKQVLLGYGCDYPSARMFAVNEGGEWRTISPTNQFDMLGMPECSHVDENEIDRSIAPVCVDRPQGEEASATYSVR